MLKLIKFEMIHSYRSFGLMFGIFLLACVGATVLPINMGMVVSSILMLLVFGIFISVFVTVIKNYNTSMFMKPGYLTLTLPVSTHKVVISKVISASVWFVVSMIILALGTFILIVGISAKQGVYIEWDIMFETFKVGLSFVSWYGFSVEVIFMIISGLASIMGLFTLCTILQTKYTRNHKVLIGFIIYICYTIVWNFIMSNLTTISITANNHIFGVDQGIWINTLYALIQLAAFYALTVYVINHKIEIE